MSRRVLIGGLGALIVGAIGAYLLYQKLGPDVYSDAPLTEQDILEGRLKYFGEVPEEEAARLEAIDPDEPVRLAIGSLGLPGEREDLALGDLVLARLGGSRGLETVERQSLNAVLQELNLSLSGLVRGSDAVRAGELLRADWFVLGSGFEAEEGKSLLLRIVDARTGVFRDAEVFPTDVPVNQLADEVSTFIRQSRENASTATQPVYLAVGTFEDMSVNSRMADFASELRTTLTAAYRDSPVTLLEREAVNELLREVRLDLAGLTAEGETPQPIQSAYWLVDGQFQSLENQNQEVELILNVRRMFDRSTELVFQGQRSLAFYNEIKSRIDQTLEANQNPLFLTRVTEVRAQLEAGERLMNNRTGLYSSRINERNREQAIQAFETVLLLEPDNRDAKKNLADCLYRMPGRTEEALDYYKELLDDADAKDDYNRWIQAILFINLSYASAEERIAWYTAASNQSHNPAAIKFYQEQIDAAREDELIEGGDFDEATKAAELRLFNEIRDMVDTELHGRSIQPYFSGPIGDFLKTFGEDRDTAVKRLDLLFPRMLDALPDFAPHISAGALAFQVQTNTLVLNEFKKQLQWSIENPNKLVKPVHFWNAASGLAKGWLVEHRHYELAASIFENQLSSIETGRIRTTSAVVDSFKLDLGRIYMRAEEWEKALDIFESFGGRPLLAVVSERWGVELPDQIAALCREKLGIEAVSDPRKFKMEIWANYSNSGIFFVEQDRVWAAVGNKLFWLDLDRKPILELELPKSRFTPNNAIQVDPNSVWIGTNEEGLIEVSRSTRQIRHWTVEDGLAMNSITYLNEHGNSLWIGYGRVFVDEYGNVVTLPTVARFEGSGGLGRLDLSSKEFEAYIPSLTNADRETVNSPTRRPIEDVAIRGSGEVYVLPASSSIQSFSFKENLWRGVTGKPYLRSVEITGDRLLVGRNWGRLGGPGINGEPPEAINTLGLEICDLAKDEWTTFPLIEGVNPVSLTTVSVHEGNVWVGGLGFIALLDMENQTVRKLSYVPSYNVSDIQFGGGYVWAQFNNAIYRAPLDEVY